jgi:hypothetical protein
MMAKEAVKLESSHEPVGRRQTKAGPKLPLALEQFQSVQASHFLADGDASSLHSTPSAASMRRRPYNLTAK